MGDGRKVGDGRTIMADGRWQLQSQMPQGGGEGVIGRRATREALGGLQGLEGLEEAVGPALGLARASLLAATTLGASPNKRSEQRASQDRERPSTAGGGEACVWQCGLPV